jgi:hypothetical protein
MQSCWRPLDRSGSDFGVRTQGRCRNASRRRINASERRTDASTCDGRDRIGRRDIVAHTERRGAAPVSHRAPQLTPRKLTIPAALGFDRSCAGCGFGDGRAASFRGTSRVRLFPAKLGLPAFLRLPGSIGSAFAAALPDRRDVRLFGGRNRSCGGICAISPGILRLSGSIGMAAQTLGTARTAQNKAAAVQDQRKTADRDDTILVKGSS